MNLIGRPFSLVKALVLINYCIKDNAVVELLRTWKKKMKISVNMMFKLD